MLADIASSALPKFAWAFILIALNLMISSYMYSTKRTIQAVIIAVFRCILLNSASVILLSMLLGKTIIWFTPGIAEAAGFIIAFTLLKNSEKNGTVYKQNLNSESTRLCPWKSVLDGLKKM